MNTIARRSSIGPFNLPHNHKAHTPLEQAQGSGSGPKTQALPISSGSTMRRVLSLQNKIPSPRERTALLQAHQYQSGMTLPADYEIVSHVSTDGQEFKIAGKRMDGDSSRFHAKNAATGETLCTLKRTPTEGGFVWMHPENSGLRGGGPSEVEIYNKQSKKWISTSMSQSQHGNAVTIKLFDSGKQNVGSLCIASGDDSLRILTIENHLRSQYRSIGSGLWEIAKRVSTEKGFGGKISLVCQDEGAAVFFYKSGLRFFGDNAEAKNDAIKKHIELPSLPLPDDVIFLGDMKTL